MSVRLRCSSWSQLVALYRRDLTRGQLFLRSKSSPKLGTPLNIQLLLPSGGTVALQGKVSVVLGADSSRGPGAVVALDPIAAADRMTLESALKSLEEKTRRTTARSAPLKTDGEPPKGGDADALSLEDGQQLVAAEKELTLALGGELATIAKLNPFQILGLGYQATDDDVKAAFGQLSKRYHPDRFVRYQSPAVSQLAEELFVRVRDAYKRTITPTRRAGLLEQIKKSRQPPPIPPPPVHQVTSHRREAKPTAPQRSRPPIVATAPTETPVDLGIAPTATPKGTESKAISKAGEQVASKAHDPTRHLGAPLKVGSDSPPRQIAPPSEADEELDPLIAFPDAGHLISERRFTDAAGLFSMAARRDDESDAAKAGIELAEGLRALEAGDRLEAAQRFEAVLDLHPANEVAARELAKMRRRATHQRQGLLIKLMKDQG